MSNKYILIDLNQTVSRHQLEEMQLEKRRNIILGAISVALLSVFVWFNVINFNLSSIISERKDRIADLNKKIDNLESESKINLSKDDVKSLFRLDEKRVFWAPKIMALTKLTPETMSITQIEFLRKKLNISAITELEEGVKEFDVVKDFISRLKSSNEFFSDFESVRFLDSSQDNVKGHKTFTFRIEAKLKSDAKRKKSKKSKRG